MGSVAGFDRLLRSMACGEQEVAGAAGLYCQIRVARVNRRFAVQIMMQWWQRKQKGSSARMFNLSMYKGGAKHDGVALSGRGDNVIKLRNMKRENPRYRLRLCSPGSN